MPTLNDTTVRRCPKCKIDKSLSEFNRSKYTSHGHEYVCRACTQIRREGYRRKLGMKPAPVKPRVDGKRQCSSCLEFKDSSEFSASKSTSTRDKLSSQCKACISKHAEQRRREKGIKPARKIVHINGGKVCSKCDEWRPLDEYSRSSKQTDGLSSVCLHCRRVYQRQFYQENRERLREWQQQYKKENPERRREISKAYRDKNPEYYRMKTRNRRARKRELLSDFTIEEWRRCLDYFHHCCAACGRPLVDLFGERTAHADHWIAITNPQCPGTTATNIVPLCGGLDGCNGSKSDIDAQEWLIRKFGKRQARTILKRIATYFEWVKQQP